MASLIGLVCAAYRSQIVQELGLGSSRLETPRYLKITAAFQQLSHHIGDLVPQPADSDQSGSSSVQQAMAAGHGAAGGACKAAGQAADLARALVEASRDSSFLISEFPRFPYPGPGSEPPSWAHSGFRPRVAFYA